MNKAVAETRQHASSDWSLRLFLRIWKLLGSRVWLPKLMYDAIPFLYAAGGLGSLWSTMNVTEWYWIVPLYVIFAAICLHLALYVIVRRIRAAHARRLARTQE